MKHYSLAFALLAAPSLVAPTWAAVPNVTVVHGIPGGDLGLPAALPVDLCLIDPMGGPETAVLAAVPFGASAGLALPPGSYDLNLRLDDAADCAGALAVPVSFVVNVAESSTVIAHLSEQGTPTFTKFVNDLRPLAAGQGRVVVRHTAAAPPVNVLLSGRSNALLRNLRNPEQSVSTTLREGTYRAQIFPATGGRRVFGPAPVPVAAGQALFVHAVGSLATGSFTVIPVPVAVP
jgi:hypothetical protein